MSNPYPSRRELRLQRQRDERAKLRDTEAERWAAERQAREAREPEKAADTSAETSDTEVPAIRPARPRRRADSEVVSTGMIPIITKPHEDSAESKPQSRRELRALEARRRADQSTDATGEEATRPSRRATSPQLTPPPVPATAHPPVLADPPTEPIDAELVEDQPTEDEITIEVSDSYQESAAEITDMSGLDTIEIRRAELRTETERLTQEIVQLGQSNPNVIDPALLRRQKQLADKSKELQDLETAAIAIVEESTRAAETSLEHDNTADESSTHDEQAETSVAQEHGDENSVALTDSPRRRARRAQSTAAITGPFDVLDDEDSKPVLHTPPAIIERRTTDPINATQAHGLDSLDAKDFEAPERRLVITAAAVFLVGIIALIFAIILFNR